MSSGAIVAGVPHFCEWTDSWLSGNDLANPKSANLIF